MSSGRFLLVYPLLVSTRAALALCSSRMMAYRNVAAVSNRPRSDMLVICVVTAARHEAHDERHFSATLKRLVCKPGSGGKFWCRHPNNFPNNASVRKTQLWYVAPLPGDVEFLPQFVTPFGKSSLATLVLNLIRFVFLC